MSIHWLDIIIGAILCWYIIKGFKNGLTEEVFQFLNLAAVIFFTIKFAVPASQWIRLKYPDLPILSTKIIAVGSIVLLVFIVFLCFKVTIKKAVDYMPLAEFFERIGGALVSFFKVGILISAIIMILSFVPSEALKQEMRQNSILVRKVIEGFPKVYNYVTSSWRSTFLLKIGNILKAHTEGSQAVDDKTEDSKTVNSEL